MKKFIQHALLYSTFIFYLTIYDNTGGYLHQVTWGPYAEQTQCMIDGEQATQFRFGLYTKFTCKSQEQIAREKYLLSLTQPLEDRYHK